MQIHGNVLTSDESGELAAIIDRDAISTGERNHEWFELNECNAERCPVCKADYASIADRSRLLALHYRLAARVAELEAELDVLLKLADPTIEWMWHKFGEPEPGARKDRFHYKFSNGLTWTIQEGGDDYASFNGGPALWTCAAVLAAVAAAKGEA